MKTIYNIYQFCSLLLLWFYKEEYQIHYRVSKVPDETQAPRSPYTECIPRLIVPSSSESDILINCNNFTKLFNDLQLTENTTLLYCLSYIH